MKKHQKHTKLSKPEGGKFHKNEIGFLGAPCGIIHQLFDKILEELKGIKLGIVDADHSDKKSTLPFHSKYTDKIGYHQLDFNDDHIEYGWKAHFNQCDGVLVNCNHFKADAQIVIINQKKEESLSRKLDKLSNVKAIILDKGMDAPFLFIKSHLGDISNVPIIDIDDVEKITNLIKKTITDNMAPLSGILLYGGQSSRMGRDKGMIEYHGKPQFQYLKEILQPKCEEVLISIAEPKESLKNESILIDTFSGLGPFGGILSAFRKDQNKAYLTLPCDVPLLDESTISELVAHRDPSKIATCFHNEETGFPEPLITIWEPKAYPRLLHFLSLGYSCPRKVLINSDIKEIIPSRQLSLYNANTPEESAIAMQKISKKVG